MPLRILLSSDLHLGMKFAAYPDVQVRLAEERYRCLDRLVAQANAKACDLLVVAGDLFERVSMGRRDVERAAASLVRFSGRLAAVLPGNHDFLAADDELWRAFRDAAGDRTLVLSEARAVGLDHYDLQGVCLYPAPCAAKHSAANAVGWVREAFRSDPPRLGVGVAHGSLEGYSPDFASGYYPMGVPELLEAGPPLWLIGHTHVPYTVSPVPGRLLACAGTPEPDGFDCRHEGQALVIEVAEDGLMSLEEVRTGGFRFADEVVTLRTSADLDALEERFPLAEASRTLLRVTLSGTLRRGERDRLEEVRGGLAERLALLDWRADAVRDQIDRRSIDEEFPAGSFPHELLAALAAKGDEAALQAAYELMQEAHL